LDPGPSAEESVGVGVQFAGAARIGTFVQGLDAATTAKLAETLDRVSKTLVAFQEGPASHRNLIYEDPTFQAALHEAQRMCDSGRAEYASRVLMDALEREEHAEDERQANRQRLRLSLLEVALTYDLNSRNTESACAKLRLIAEVSHPDNLTARKKYLFDRALEYQGIGTVKGDQTALLIAVFTLSWLAKEAVNVERE